MYSTENELDSITCPQKEHSKVADIEKLIKNPGRVPGIKGVYSNFYDIYTNEAFNTLIVKVPKIDSAGIKFITVFMPDKKANQLTNYEDDRVDLFNPDIVTDSNYDYNGNNMLYFGNNDKENVYCPKVYLIKEKLDTIFLDANERTTKIDNKYNSIVETFPLKANGCCHFFIDIMPYIRNEMIKWIYSKSQILNMLNNDSKDDYNSKTEINNFINRLHLNITQIQVFPTNIRVGFHAKLENYDWEKSLLDEIGLNDIIIDELSSFYIKVLPEDPMVGRVYDRRVGYFTIDKRVIDPNSFTNDIKLITRLRIPEAIDYIYKIYVDPVVPAKYYGVLRDMIGKFNREFLFINGFNPFKLITVDEIEFPEDFDRHDLRYPVISLTQNRNTGYWGISNTLVDGRSGEIIWFQLLLNTELTTEQNRLLLDYTGASTTFANLTSGSVSKLDRSIKVQRKFLSRLQKKNIMPCFLPQDGDTITISPSSNEYKILLQSVMTHEMGHCLGLRHNFAGSVNGNTAQDSSSIMDYHNITQGWISLNTPNSTPKITPGIYDKYAITYGYIMLAGEITGIKHSSLDGLAAGYTLEQSEILDNTTFLATPLNPVFLTDENIAIDPRGSLYDHGSIFDWVNIERSQYETTRANLLQTVKDRKISQDTYTKLYISSFIRILRGGFDAISKYHGGFLYDLNKLTYRTSTRLECVKSLQYLLKYVGDYNSDAQINVDSAFTNNMKNLSFNPTEEELRYLRAASNTTYSTHPLQLDVLQSNLNYLILEKLIGFASLNKMNRMIETDKIGETKNEIYPRIDTTTLASYMSTRDFMLTLSFSPGSVINGNENPQMPRGTPWLYFSYWAFYKSSFAVLPIVPFAGIYNDGVLINPPYPITAPPGVPTPLPQMPTPIPYTSPGIFPEVSLWLLYLQQLSGGFTINSNQFLSHLRKISIMRKNKRVQFLNILLSYARGLINDTYETTRSGNRVIDSNLRSGETNSFNEIINLIAATIVRAYNPSNSQSVISLASLPENNFEFEAINHLTIIYNLAIEITNTINSKVGLTADIDIDNNLLINNVNFESKKILATAKQNIAKRQAARINKKSIRK